MQDMFPVLAFVLSYVIARYTGYNEEAIFIATGVLMIVTILQIIWMLARRKKIELRHWATLAVIIVLGGITLIIHDDMFIKLKPTVLNVIIAAVFLGSQFVGKANLTKRMLHSAFDMPDILWNKLNLAWVAFFLFEGALNVYMALNFDNDTYVSFKFWGLMILTFAFLIAQFIFLRKYLRKDKHDGE